MSRRKKKDMFIIEDTRGMAQQQPQPQAQDNYDLSEFENVFDDSEPQASARGSRRREKDEEPEVVTTLVSESPRPKLRRILSVPFGILMFVLSVIGLIASIRFCSGAIRKITSHEQEMLTYEEMLEPVVMYDPTTFDDLSNADPVFLLQSSIWKTVTVNTYPTQFEMDESGRQIVPVEMVEESFRSLFGNDVAPTHRSFTGYGIEIEYSETQNAYLVPSVGITPIYYPDVLSMTKRGDSVILRVGYIASADLTEVQNGVYKTPEPAKYMNVTLRSNEGEKYISAIQAAE